MANRLMVNFDEYGFLPINDEPFTFETDEPLRIGDDAIIFCQGQRIPVRLLKSSGHVSDSTYLVAIKNG